MQCAAVAAGVHIHEETPNCLAAARTHAFVHRTQGTRWVCIGSDLRSGACTASAAPACPEAILSTFWPAQSRQCGSQNVRSWRSSCWRQKCHWLQPHNRQTLHRTAAAAYGNQQLHRPDVETGAWHAPRHQGGAATLGLLHFARLPGCEQPCLLLPHSLLHHQEPERPL